MPPTITKMVTLAIHKRMQKYLFGNGEKSILELDQRGVRTSQGCKEAVIEIVASNLTKKEEKREVVELYSTSKKLMTMSTMPFWWSSTRFLTSRPVSRASSSR